MISKNENIIEALTQIYKHKWSILSIKKATAYQQADDVEYFLFEWLGTECWRRGFILLILLCTLEFLREALLLKEATEAAEPWLETSESSKCSLSALINFGWSHSLRAGSACIIISFEFLEVVAWTIISLSAGYLSWSQHLARRKEYIRSLKIIIKLILVFNKEPSNLNVQELFIGGHIV